MAVREVALSLRLGVDVGGTFTDLFLYDSDAGSFWLAKTPSTPADQSVGVVEGLVQICDRAGIPAESLDAVLHGMTVATNAVLEGRGARVGLIVTEGWGHLLHLAESWTPGPLFGFFSYQKPEPLVPFEDVREVGGRMDAAGAELRPTDSDEVRSRVVELVDSGVEALTICLLNSHANASHELAVEEVVGEVLAERGKSDLPVSRSSDITPEFREYERMVTTVMNSYLGPVMRGYLGRVESKLHDHAVQAPLQVVRSDGGLMSVGAARNRPVQSVLSGPSGGVNGAAFVAKNAGFERIMTFDMGGTSTDVAVCFDGVPTVTRETRVGPFPARAASVEVETIGAGGGSIANVSPITGGLRVGPQSAGADPGPACYGRGGTEATVTDANVVLGHLPPELLGGSMRLDVEAAHAAVQNVADLLGVDVHRAALGIIDIVNENMLGALRVVSVQKGLDPGDFALVSFGGAGGMHANALAATLGCYPVIVPPEPGVLSALGFVAADIRNEFVTSYLRLVSRSSVDDLRASLGLLGERGRAWLDEEGVALADQAIRYVIDMRFHHQGYEISIELQEGEADTLDFEALVQHFRREHERLYGFSLPSEVELVNLRVRAIGRVPKPELPEREAGPPDPVSARTSTQRVWLDGNYQDVPLYERNLLRPGMRVDGLSVVAQYDATTLILPGHVAEVDSAYNLLIWEAR